VVLVLNGGDNKKFDARETVLKSPAGMKQKFSPERMIHPAAFNPPAAFPHRAGRLSHILNRSTLAAPHFSHKFPPSARIFQESYSQIHRIHKTGTGPAPARHMACAQ
jgi:hypothetical protein